MNVLKRNKNIIFLILLSLLCLLPIFTGGFYASHDSETHVARAAMYKSAISTGQFPPRWAASANYGYGSPFFVFFYPLSGYVVATLNFLGITLENSYLIIAALAFILGGAFFYLWSKQIFSKKIALLAAVFYILLPYRFLTLFVRGALGELMAFSLLPLLFFFIERAIKKSSLSNTLLAGIVFGLIILSHNGISLFFTPIIILYALLKGKKTFVQTLFALTLGFCLSAFFWIPSLIEMKYTNGLFYFADMYKDNFVKLPGLIYSAWGFGPEINSVGGLSAQAGPFSFAILLSALILLLKKRFKHEKTIIIFWVSVFLVGCFFATAYSSIFWDSSDFLKRLQFPWRFMVLSSFAAAALCPFVFSKLNNKLVYLFILSYFLFSLQYVRVVNSVSHPDSDYFSYQGSTSFHNESTTIWMAGDPSKKAKNQIEIIGGIGEISSQRIESAQHIFSVNAQNDLILLDNTVYFPGWTVRVDGKKIPVQFQDPNNRGLITFSVPKGKHSVAVKFEETLVRLVSDLISLLSICVVAIVILINSIKKIVKRCYLFLCLVIFRKR